MATQVKIVIYRKLVGPNYDWDHDVPPRHKTKKGLKFKNNYKGEKFDITFQIDNGAGLKFDEQYPFSISWRTGDCPDKGHMEDDFSVTRLSDDTILVHNMNEWVWKYRYRLDFIDTSTKAPVTWDPIVDNQDGNHGYIVLALKILAGIATVVVAVHLAAELF